VYRIYFFYFMQISKFGILIRCSFISMYETVSELHSHIKFVAYTVESMI
jgi:hypothetical protein